jgi:hypothetical protein
MSDTMMMVFVRLLHQYFVLLLITYMLIQNEVYILGNVAFCLKFEKKDCLGNKDPLMLTTLLVF